MLSVYQWKECRPKRSTSPNSLKKTWYCHSAKTMTGSNGSRLPNKRNKSMRGLSRGDPISKQIGPSMKLLYLMWRASWTCRFLASLRKMNQTWRIQRTPWRLAIWGSIPSNLCLTSMDSAKISINTIQKTKNREIFIEKSRTKNRGQDHHMDFFWKVAKMNKSRLALET